MRNNIYIVLVLLGTVLFGRDADAEVSPESPKPDRSKMIFKPYIHYPLEARRAGMVGSGIVLLKVDPETGKVIDAQMAQSTGNPVLDRASTTAMMTARFAPGTASIVKIPINWTMGGGAVYNEYRVHSENMDDVLARFLGKGTVLKGPIPAYPRSPAWTNKTGKGVYELSADKEGRVYQVRILKPSGDETFDRTAVKTLRKWRLRRGPLILELPLAFKLSPNSYTVDVAR